MSPMSAIVRRMANMAGASVVNIVSFAVGSAVHTTVISALLAQADTPGMGLLALVLCLITTVDAFILLFPLLSLTNIVGLSSGQRGMHAVRRAGRLASRYAITRKAVSDGEDDAQGDSDEPPLAAPPIQVASTRQQSRVRVGAGPAESFDRPDPSGLRAPLGIGAPIAARTTPTAGGHRALRSSSNPPPGQQ